ncbi:Alkaline phosphatase 4 [Andreprevotia sp. IGB-42]|uniref:alkaline phosphatase n=1 Tax=Andreprevotia sp. IGB-42 TaxID=2497473 RepID=UPI001356ECE2|nr:alkaline phosphatase [Andreprevotia sp. IGB-42]KAF0813668.1 Alkaline phosphatase 4 [Andreprevotia sp. IGB-42]
MKAMMLKHTLIAATCVAAFSPVHAAGEAKNVIFFLGDGMGPATVTAARIYKYGEAGSLSMEKLDRTARVKTYSNDAQTTDSAPSMAAYMTGVKMNNEVISMSPDTRATDPATGKSYLNGTDSTCPASNGKAVDTMLEIAKGKGKAVGAITTTRITHATPAATYSHVCHRDAENTIAAQAVPGGAGYNAKLGTGLDVLMGGGSRFFLPTTVTGGKRTDGRNLINEMKAQGYTYASTGAELKAIDGKATSKLFALFTNDHMDYELDRVKKSLDQPSLTDMTLKSIDVLGKNANGFFLMVEGGRIDHALHATNAKRALEDAVAFDNAIQAALTEMEKRDPGLKNTLIVVTADHDHTMTINGYGKKGSNILGTVKNYKDGTELKDADGNNYTALVFGNGPNRPATRKMLVEGTTDATQVLHDDYLQESALRMGSESHGGGDVMLFATGAGVASKTFKGVIDNTKVFNLIKQAYGF